MCTVVLRRFVDSPVQILALRDESITREFDDPDAWWPDFPDVVGGRDRTAGGTWCATHVGTGTTALVVNRPAKRDADPGAPSRGVLPLLAARHGLDWRDHVDLRGMASFALLLARPDRALTWDFDGSDVRITEHPVGTHMLTSGGPEDRKADRFLASFAATDPVEGWLDLLRQTPPRDDPGALLVRHEEEGRVWATVFAELIDTRPGTLRIEYSRRPWTDDPWQTFAVG